jgi:hypothetical protein
MRLGTELRLGRWLWQLRNDLCHRFLRIRRRLLRELRRTLLLRAADVGLPGVCRSVLRLVLHVSQSALQPDRHGLSTGWSWRAGTDGTIDTGEARQRPRADIDIALAFGNAVNGQHKSRAPRGTCFFVVITRR